MCMKEIDAEKVVWQTDSVFNMANLENCRRK